MDYNCPNKRKVTVHCISERGTTAEALLDLWAYAGYPSSLWDPFSRETSFIFPLLLIVQLWEYTAVVFLGALLGKTALKHVCFTGVWEEAPLVKLSSTVLCRSVSICWPHRCSCSNIHMQRLCICLKIPHVPLHFQICTVSVAEKMNL